MNYASDDIQTTYLFQCGTEELFDGRLFADPIENVPAPGYPAY
jgi:hypothetical protein